MKQGKHSRKRFHYVSYEEGLHACDELRSANENRDGESDVHIFQDYGSCRFNIQVGLEFIEVNFCPFCGEQLCEEK
jgi:hypothetical protein